MSVAHRCNTGCWSLIIGYMYGCSYVLVSIGDIFLHANTLIKLHCFYYYILSDIDSLD